MPVALWNLPPPPGFQGLDPAKALILYHRHLPHWRQDGATYFVTFRLADSLPQSRLQQLDILKCEWEAKHPTPRTDRQWEELARMTVQRVEEWLDQGMGNCWLKRAEIAQCVLTALHFFDGERYELGCYVVMPNHVHAVIRPFHPTDDPLERILQSRKRQMSRDINRILGRCGPLWQDESFDRIIRDEEHLYRCIQYIGQNPGKAGLSHYRVPGERLIAEACPMWIRPEWEQLGWQLQFDA
jgi:REP-associated tyrosine transposase